MFVYHRVFIISFTKKRIQKIPQIFLFPTHYASVHCTAHALRAPECRDLSELEVGSWLIGLVFFQQPSTTERTKYEPDTNVALWMWTWYLMTELINFSLRSTSISFSIFYSSQLTVLTWAEFSRRSRFVVVVAVLTSFICFFRLVISVQNESEAEDFGCCCSSKFNFHFLFSMKPIVS